MLSRMKALRDMEGARVLVALRHLKTSAYAFHRNYQELMRFISFCEDDASNRLLGAMTERKKASAYGREGVRLLCNFEASALALRDHMKMVTNEFHDRHASPEFGPRYDEFHDDPVVRIAHELRAYLTHVRAPWVLFQTHVDRPGDPIEAWTLKVGITLERDFLRRKGLGLGARQQLREMEGFLHLRPLVEEYAGKVRDFSIWYDGRERSVHQAAIADYEAKDGEYFAQQIDERLERYFDCDSPRNFGDTHLFIGLFDDDDFNRLESLPACSPERVELMLQLLREHLEVTPELEAKLRKAYSEERFFARVRLAPGLHMMGDGLVIELGGSADIPGGQDDPHHGSPPTEVSS